MSSHKEIGGYMELESYGAATYHKGSVLLNSGRNALKYIIRAYDIKKLFIPYYTCPVVWEVVKEESCELLFYDINSDFMPTQKLPEGAFILVNDYFGVCSENIDKLADLYENMIVDNAQSFYSKPKGIGSFYSPRKFFGLPDGGLLYCEKRLNQSFEKDVSHNKVSHLLKRHDLGPSNGYKAFIKNEDSFVNQPIREMSDLTKALMGNISYEKAREARCANFENLHKHLVTINELKLSSNYICPLCYPLLLKQKGVRDDLKVSKIYTPQYWNGIEAVAPVNSYSSYISEHLIPLPIDQRYTVEDMKVVLEVLYASI